MPVPTSGALAEQRHGLTLHVRAHQRAVGVVVFEERNEAAATDTSCFGDTSIKSTSFGQATWIVAVLRAVTRSSNLPLVEFGVRLRDGAGAFLLHGRQVLDLVGHLAILRPCGTGFR
jgi:hypothetical protein